jgi:hypothetical protein
VHKKLDQTDSQNTTGKIYLVSENKILDSYPAMNRKTAGQLPRVAPAVRKGARRMAVAADSDF